MLAKQTGSALGVAERDQIFAQEPHANRRAVRRRNLLGQQRGEPISPHQFAHGRLSAYAGQQIVVILPKHGQNLSTAWNDSRRDSGFYRQGILDASGKLTHPLLVSCLVSCSGLHNQKRRKPCGTSFCLVRCRKKMRKKIATTKPIDNGSTTNIEPDAYCSPDRRPTAHTAFTLC